MFGAKFYAHLSLLEAHDDAGALVSNTGELVLYPGGTFGLEYLWSDNFALFPEVTFLFPYFVDFEKFLRPVWQGGLSFQFRFAL